ncbi:Ribosome-binding factor A [Usitatibacter rugosus]|uniref:Ribosome-binding factor A n=1 Tax=Usitatibacter rugosus TaxID=2732067 RepID=A0A6M4GSU6_9PROT|nr:30S ribosome-binding factor RbfA [Usitatibacter rugosus]QJR10321.1 Ribosome-binding factor A [Usitatibacter rugosus]
MAVARSHRIAEQIQRELAELVRLEVRDPRVRLVTLTAVELSRDHSHAKVFFTTLDPAADAEATQEGLERAAGFLRSSLSHRLSTRTVPELHFAYDESVERGVRLSKLIDDAVGTPAVPTPAPEAPAPAKPRRTRGGGAAH